ncbi:Hypothetical predicted protein [Cloeon dipterum]|uniref:Uncharacterized protein n=2 Tax=Cloeon dipterum TaxID=197152 RepID=A0A8S1DCK2_9INSE|nr:Hypothetical predicted protein [Cloeon dipterum]
MSNNKCPFCGQPIYLQSCCVNWRTCSSFRGQYKKLQKVRSSKSCTTVSQHSKGKVTGQQPTTSQESGKKILRSYRKIAPSVSNQAGGSATGKSQLQNKAGSGQNPTQKEVPIVKNKSGKSKSSSMQLVAKTGKKDEYGRRWINYKVPKSHGMSASGSVAQNPSLQQPVAGPSSAVTPVQSSKQILKDNKASRDAQQNFGRSGEAIQQASASQGEDRNFPQQSMQMLAIGPVGTFDRVTQAPLSAPVAAASTSRHSFPGTSQNPPVVMSIPQYYYICTPQATVTNQLDSQRNSGLAARVIQPEPNPQHVGQNDEATTSHGMSTSDSVAPNPSLQQPVAGPSSAVSPVQPSKQILKVNKASRDAQQNLGRSGEAKKQAQTQLSARSSQGEDRNFHQRMQEPAIDPVDNTFGNVASLRMALVAAASTPPLVPWPSENPLADMSIPQYYDFCNPQDTATDQMNFQLNSGYSEERRAMQPAANPQHVGQSEASTSHGTSASGPAVSPMHTDNDATGFCLMCEMFVLDVDQHWSDWHGSYGVEPNDCYVVAKFKSKRMLFCSGTDLEKELHECTSCLKADHWTEKNQIGLGDIA